MMSENFHPDDPRYEEPSQGAKVAALEARIAEIERMLAVVAHALFWMPGSGGLEVLQLFRETRKYVARERPKREG